MSKRRVAIYVRVSGEEQVKGYSIAEQKDRLQTYCQLKDWIAVRVFEDPAYSGGTMDRPGLQSMLSACRKGSVDTVLVWKLDRLSRSQKDTLYLIEDVFKPLGIAFVAETQNLDTSTPLGMAMIGIMAAFAQLERDQIKERMEMGRVGRAKSGKWRGGAGRPTGYDFTDGLLVINEYEALQIREIFRLFLEGKSLRSICLHMKEHYANEHVGYTDPHMISKILRNPLYIGKIQYKGEIYDGLHDSIIDNDTFQRAQDLYREMAEKNHDKFHSPFQGKHLLSGLLFCGHCGARYFVHGGVRYIRQEDGKYKKTKQGYYYYKCYSRDGNSHMKKIKGCKNPNYRVEELDAFILDEIRSLHFDEGKIEEIMREVRPQREDPVPALRKELKTTERKISRLLGLYASNLDIDAEDLASQIKPLYEARDRLRKEIEELMKEKRPSGYLTEKQVRERLRDVDILDGLDLARKRALVNDLIERIVLHEKAGEMTIYWRF